MTSMGARQHLQALEEAGLVEHFDVKVQVGRPTRHWKLTGQGHERFLDGHGDLTVQFIEAVENIFGQEGMVQIAHERKKELKKLEKAEETTEKGEIKESIRESKRR